MNLFSKIVVCSIACLLLGLVSGLLTGHAPQVWFENLHSSAITPNRPFFPLFWILFYILLGTSAALVWQAPTQNKKTAFIFFGISLLLNLLWFPLFFLFKATSISLINITLLWLSLVITICLFYRHSKLAAFFLACFFLWITAAWLITYIGADQPQLVRSLL